MTESFADDGLILTPGRVAVLTLNRPARRNAMTAAMWAAIPGICDRIAGDATIRVLVVTGEGPAAFCAGADMSEFERVYATPESTGAYNATVRAAQARLRDLPCPTVAAIRGACFGGGCGLALACDLRVADATARLAITPAKLGLAYSPADTWQLIEKVGVVRAKDLLLTGRAVDAAEALAIGLVDRTSDDAAAASRTLARDLATLAPGALAAIKAICNGLSTPDASAALHTAFEATFRSAEFREGYSAFLEKRPPDFDKYPAQERDR